MQRLPTVMGAMHESNTVSPELSRLESHCQTSRRRDGRVAGSSRRSNGEATDGPALVQSTRIAAGDRSDVQRLLGSVRGALRAGYVREKVHEPATGSYNALVEALVADEDAPWAAEFTAEDRAVARARLGAMLEAHREELEAAESRAVEDDRKIAAAVSARRTAKGKPPLTPEQEATMRRERADRRAVGT